MMEILKGFNAVVGLLCLAVRRSATMAPFILAPCAWRLHAASPAWSSEPVPALRGRVTTAGEAPIPGAEIMIWSQAAGGLRDAEIVSARSRADGSFEITPPLAAVRYTVWIHSPGYESRTLLWLAGEGDIEVVLPLRPRRSLVGRVLELQGGSPAGGAVVRIVGGGLDRSVACDACGDFRFEELPLTIVAAIVYAETAEGISPYRILGGREDRVDLELGSPARVDGLVRAPDRQAPFADGVVFLRPPFVSDFRISTRSAADGSFRFDRVPPGRYEAGIAHEAYYEIHMRGDFVERPEMTLAAGKTAFHPIDVLPMARLTGRVLGPEGIPVPDALVGVSVAYDQRQVWRTARTDAAGRFAVPAGGSSFPKTLQVFSPSSGGGSLEVRNIQAGEERDVGDIALSGAVRVRGQVKDPDGRPIPRVRVSHPHAPVETEITDQAGRFDLGWFAGAAPAVQGQVLHLIAPRPGCGITDQVVRLESGSPAEKAAAHDRLFLHKAVPYDAAPGQDVSVDATLQPTEWMFLSGRVVDPDRRPIAGTSVLVFAGNADASRWQAELNPMTFLPSSVANPARESVLGRAQTDVAGGWSIAVARETADSLRIQHPDSPAAPSSFSVGLRAPSGASLLIRNIDMRDAAQWRRELLLETLPAEPRGAQNPVPQ